MPLAPVISTSLTTPTTFTGLGVRIGGTLFTNDIKWDTLRIEDGGPSSVGQISFTIMLPISGLSDVYDQAEVIVHDFDAGDDVARGFVVSRRPFVAPTYSWTEVTANDHSSLLDDSFIANERRPSERMKRRISFLWGKYAPAHLPRDLSHVASIGTNIEETRFVSFTLRQAIEASLSEASEDADYYLDTLGKLHVFESESNDAPFNINADSPGAGEIAPMETLEIDYDSGVYANQVYVQGFNRAGSGYFQSGSAIAAANGLIRTTSIQAPHSRTARQAQRHARMYLGRVALGIVRGRFVTASPNDGWRAGQNVEITSADHGLSGEAFRITQVTTTLLRPGVDAVRQYDVSFGGSEAGEDGT